jgi:hypothetical protein
MIWREVWTHVSSALVCDKLLTECSAKSTARTQGPDILTIEEEFRTGERCAISRLQDSTACAKPDGDGRGMCFAMVNDRSCII